jgi:hypothetical protein
MVDKVVEKVVPVERGAMSMDINRIYRTGEYLSGKMVHSEVSEVKTSTASVSSDSLERTFFTSGGNGNGNGTSNGNGYGYHTATITGSSNGHNIDADSVRQDDLTLIEGIGPKLSEVMHHAGIYNFEQLASLSVNRLRQILNNAGPTYRVFDPTTWPAQAELASKGKWEELKAWQVQLNGGR